jgi:hypothetical protein
VSNIALLLREHIPTLLFVCCVFYQYGFSYHLSLGSLGLIVLLLVGWRHITTTSLILSIFIPALIITAYVFHLVKYGESEYLARILRYCFTAWLLFLLIIPNLSIKRPPVSLVFSALSMMIFFALYQNFIDPFAKASNSLMALKTEFLDVSNVADIYVSEQNGQYRASGPYTEPSVLALLASCLLLIGQCYKERTKRYIIGMSLTVIFLSGSLLGYIGFIGIMFLAYKKQLLESRLSTVVVLLAMPAVFYAFTFLLEGRSFEGDNLLDSSLLARVVYPFIIIYENFMNNDFLGYCGDLYTHFLSLGIYNSPGGYPGHNGFLALIQMFGVFGIIIIVFLFRRLESPIEYFIVFLIGSQSGNFFSYEKVFLMVYMILICRHISVIKLSNEPGRKVEL